MELPPCVLLNPTPPRGLASSPTAPPAGRSLQVSGQQGRVAGQDTSLGPVHRVTDSSAQPQTETRRAASTGFQPVLKDT